MKEFGFWLYMLVIGSGSLLALYIVVQEGLRGRWGLVILMTVGYLGGILALTASAQLRESAEPPAGRLRMER